VRGWYGPDGRQAVVSCLLCAQCGAGRDDIEGLAGTGNASGAGWPVRSAHDGLPVRLLHSGTDSVPPVRSYGVSLVALRPGCSSRAPAGRPRAVTGYTHSRRPGPTGESHGARRRKCSRRGHPAASGPDRSGYMKVRDLGLLRIRDGLCLPTREGQGRHHPTARLALGGVRGRFRARDRKPRRSSKAARENDQSFRAAAEGPRVSGPFSHGSRHRVQGSRARPEHHRRGPATVSGARQTDATGTRIPASGRPGRRTRSR